MSSDPLADDKLWAEEMCQAADSAGDYFYWTGVRVGLGNRFDLAAIMVEGIGAEDETIDAKGRGARDGLAWAAEVLGVTIV